MSGVAALIISQYGHLGPDGDMPPSAVEDLLYGSAVDIGIPGEDECYGLGRVDALRAVLRDTSYYISTKRGTVCTTSAYPRAYPRGACQDP